LLQPSLISVVDDDQAFHDSVRSLFRSLGYAVAVFSSAELAATACLVADVQMPVMAGLELCAHLVISLAGLSSPRNRFIHRYQLAQSDPRITLQKSVRWKRGSLYASTSSLTVPKVLSGRCLMPS
jgi:hypothetical protein